MTIGETTEIGQRIVQNNEAVTASNSESASSSWNGRGVSLSAVPVVLVAVVALAVLAQGANAYPISSWTDTQCGYNFWGGYDCWMKECHFEEVCTHIWGIARCHLEEVCTHYN
ncbi:MAG TPA: hypothetical protein VGP47_02820 [Parachlamydiaceae bacterium]|nr:hypothetical protein [Parachlamydiaceae bacterium]